jgi:hypothetical protein
MKALTKARLRLCAALTLFVLCAPALSVAETSRPTPIRDSLKNAARQEGFQPQHTTAISATPRKRHTALAVLIGAGAGFTLGSVIAYRAQETDLREGDLVRFGLGFAAVGAGVGFVISRIP